MKIGILMCGHAPAEVQDHYGDYDTMFAGLLTGYDLTFQAWDIEAMDFPDDPTQADGWLISGARHGAYEGHDFIAPLEDFIRTANDKKIPMVGVCFGHQIIAQALGGTVEKASVGWTIGRYEYDFQDLGHLHLNAWHQDQVITPPPGARTLASTPTCPHAALQYDSHILTVQPHPEMTGPIIAEYVRLRRGTSTYPDTVMQRALEKTTKPTDEAVVAGEFARFLKAAHANKRITANV